MTLKKFFNRKLIGVSLVLITLTGGAVCFKQYFVPQDQVTLGQVDIQALLKKHPDWQKYTELQDELEKLRQKWGTSNRQNTGETGKGGLNNSSELRSQVGEIERIYTEENKLKLADLNKSIKEYVQTKTQQLNQLLNDRLKSINSRLTSDIQRKTQENESKLQAYFLELQSEYQVTLSNLQLQLSLLDISSNPANAKAEREKIQAEINRIQTEIGRKKAIKQSALQKELETWAETEKKAAHQEFEHYKTEKESELKNDILAYRQKLENNFSNWHKQQKDDLDSAKKLREEKWEKDYRQDSVRETIIKSQQEQLKEAMLWDIRQKAKLVARTKKVDCVVTHAVVNVNAPDLTEALTRIIQK
ncbi:MAG TPA: hypothetical protein VEC37_12865 [Bacillota bacterium]|nr:hypothetical protein [Bacillota bacterium]